MSVNIETAEATSPRPVRPPRAAKLPKAVVQHKRAIAIFIVPFAVLFALFYLVPIGYAVYQSLLVIERDGTFGQAREVFGGLAQYAQVFQNGPFWQSVGRVLLFGVVQVPVMLGLALLFALLLDSPLLRGKRFFRLAFFVPYAVPGVIAAIMWGFLYSPNLSPFTAITQNVDFLSADLVLWSIANVVTWVFVGYNMLIIYSVAALDPAGDLRGRAARRRRSVPHRLVDQDPAGGAGDRAHGDLLDHRHAPAARRAAGVPLVQLGREQHLHPEHDRLRHLVDPEHEPRGRLLGRAGAGDLRPVVHVPEVHAAKGRQMTAILSTGRGPQRAACRAPARSS